MSDLQERWLNVLLGVNTATRFGGVAAQATQIVDLINAREVAWYAFLFPQEFE